ncbi:hypothetical protein MQC88_12825 [Luteimonas sp. 50]|uniref:Lipoprotein n=1 Tax=Cognatiluteimonas sedimenti TaxID=2927791 RepID=A0ABT0A769_9GAMM|nr:hypothetical protein [Lysobacter sedimenti]MCJ0826824.1 hypothetical protein [Lysobacter sedimenti]
MKTLSKLLPCALLPLALLLALSACDRRQRLAEQAAAQAATQAAIAEDSAKQAEAAFDNAVAQQNWRMAKAQADVLLAQYPQTGAAARVRKQFDAVAEEAEAAREQSRTAALWSYNREPVKGGTQVSASLYAKDEVDVDGSGAKPVRLIFRDHPSWGKSAYLVLQAGDFDCYGGCKVQVKVDDDAPKAMAASRPKTDEAIAMFIEDERALWRMTRDAKRLQVQFPTKAVGRKAAVFEVGGLDRAQLPGWD